MLSAQTECGEGSGRCCAPVRGQLQPDAHCVLPVYAADVTCPHWQGLQIDDLPEIAETVLLALLSSDPCSPLQDAIFSFKRGPSTILLSAEVKSMPLGMKNDRPWIDRQHAQELSVVHSIAIRNSLACGQSAFCCAKSSLRAVT